MNTQWRYDIDAAKTGERVILAITGPLSKEMVLTSGWIAKEERFSCTSKEKNTVVAWMPWPSYPAAAIADVLE